MKLQHDPVISLADLSGDLGRRYKTTPTGGASFDPGLVDSDLAAVQRDGYVIWENLLSEEECERIRDAVNRYWITTAATPSKAAARNVFTAS